MSIHIDLGKYVIRTDPLNLILLEKKTFKTGKKAGQDYEDPIGYYRSFSHLAEALLLRGVRMSDCKTLEEIQDSLEKFASDIKDLIIAGFK